MGGPVAGKTLVIGRLPGLTGELFGFRYRKKVVDHLVGLGPVAGEVKGDAHAGQIRDIRIDLVHAPVGLFPLFVPLGQESLQFRRAGQGDGGLFAKLRREQEMRGLGKGVKSFKEGVNEAKEEIEKAKDEVNEPSDKK